MKLNKLESRFFDQILNAELGIPVHAQLEHGDDTFEVILVPELNEDGQFVLKYYNAPQYEPEPRTNEAGVNTKSFTDDEAFGRHPSLKQAWLDSSQIAVRMRSSQLPFKPGLSQKLKATVLYAGLHHRGSLGLEANQVTLQESSLQRAELSLVGFPDFESPSRPFISAIDLSQQERECLQSLATRLGDNASISIRPASRHITLDSKDGWTVKLTRDDQRTRDMVGHTGLIERTNGQVFESEELSNVLDVLRYFFVFVAGGYCHPTVVVGYDPSSRPVWGEIGQFSNVRHSFLNWFNNSNTVCEGTALEDLFPMFWTKWMNHKDEMVAVLECYAHSNAMRRAGVPKDAVAKSYAGLEILASLVRQNTIPYHPSKEVHRVLSCFKVPNLCLNQGKTPVMARLFEDLLDEPAFSGAYLLGKVRNYVVHPLELGAQAEVKQKYLKYLDVDSGNYFYLHDLSQFYLEYVFLKFLGFEVGDNHRQLQP